MERYREPLPKPAGRTAHAQAPAVAAIGFNLPASARAVAWMERSGIRRGSTTAAKGVSKVHKWHNRDLSAAPVDASRRWALMAVGEVPVNDSGSKGY